MLFFFFLGQSLIYDGKAATILDVKSSIDAFGVETSSAPFTKQPTLYLNVLQDIYGNKNRRKNQDKYNHHRDEKDEHLEKRIRRAEQLLAADMLVNKKLNNTWYLAKQQRPHFNSRQLACFAYSILEPDFMYADFNSVSSAFRDNSSYPAYGYKGLFALLQLRSRPYDQYDFAQLYRGVSYVQKAEIGQYIRFNRFLSTSTEFSQAQAFAGQKGSILYFLMGDDPVMVNHVAPYSLQPYDKEHLLTQDTQFFVTDVQSNVLMPNGNRTTVVTLVPVAYPAATAIY